MKDVFLIYTTHDYANCKCGQLDRVYATREDAEHYLNAHYETRTTMSGNPYWRDVDARTDFYLEASSIY